MRPKADSGSDSLAARASDPATLILTSLADGPKHGYGLIQDIEAFAGVRLGPGTLYGAIGRLEERGLIEALDTDGRRRPYQLSVRGAEALETALSDLREIVRIGTSRLAAPSARRVVPLGTRA